MKTTMTRTGRHQCTSTPTKMALQSLKSCVICGTCPTTQISRMENMVMRDLTRLLINSRPATRLRLRRRGDQVGALDPPSDRPFPAQCALQPLPIRQRRMPGKDLAKSVLMQWWYCRTRGPQHSRIFCSGTIPSQSRSLPGCENDDAHLSLDCKVSWTNVVDVSVIYYGTVLAPGLY